MTEPPVTLKIQPSYTYFLRECQSFEYYSRNWKKMFTFNNVTIIKVHICKDFTYRELNKNITTKYLIHITILALHTK